MFPLRHVCEGHILPQYNLKIDATKVLHNSRAFTAHLCESSAGKLVSIQVKNCFFFSCSFSINKNSNTKNLWINGASLSNLVVKKFIMLPWCSKVRCLQVAAFKITPCTLNEALRAGRPFLEECNALPHSWKPLSLALRQGIIIKSSALLESRDNLIATPWIPFLWCHDTRPADQVQHFLAWKPNTTGKLTNQKCLKS